MSESRRSQLLNRARRLGQRLHRTLRVGRPPSQRPLPRVRVGLGPTVPGWVLRVMVAAVAAGCAAPLVVNRVTAVLAVAGVLAQLVRPSGVAAGVFVVGVGLASALTPLPSSAWRTALFVAGVHLLVQLAMVVSSVSWSTVLELRVLLGPARRFLVLQGIAQLLSLAGGQLTSRSLSVPVLAVLAGVGVTALAWWLLSRLAE